MPTAEDPVYSVTLDRRGLEGIVAWYHVDGLLYGIVAVAPDGGAPGEQNEQVVRWVEMQGWGGALQYHLTNWREYVSDGTIRRRMRAWMDLQVGETLAQLQYALEIGTAPLEWADYRSIYAEGWQDTSAWLGEAADSGAEVAEDAAEAAANAAVVVAQKARNAGLWAGGILTGIYLLGKYVGRGK